MGKGNDATATSGKRDIFYWLKNHVFVFLLDAWVKKKQGE